MCTTWRWVLRNGLRYGSRDLCKLERSKMLHQKHIANTINYKVVQLYSTRTAVLCAYSTTYVARQCELILTSNLKIPVHSLLLQYLIIKVFPSSHSLAVSLSSQSIFFVNFSQLCTIFSIFSKHSRQEAKEKT